MMNNLRNLYSYEGYIGKVDYYLSKDNRELNYQNRVVIPFLEEVYRDKKNIDVVDVSTLYRNWERKKWHDRKKYAGFYTPDILVAENWNICNRNEDGIKYFLLIEVKTPVANDRKHAEKEVEEYRQHVSNVILTDCINWEFYFSNGETKTICLEEQGSSLVCKRGDNKKVIWKKCTNERNINPEKMDETSEVPEEWIKLHEALLTCLEVDD